MKYPKDHLLMLIVLTASLLYENPKSFAQSYQWAQGIGSTADDLGQSIAVDASENVYVTGYFEGTADFDPGTGTANLTSEGSRDIFFAKYNAYGNYVFAHSIGASSLDQGNGIAIDGSGNIYIIGQFYKTADFDPGAGTANLTSSGASYPDAFLAKYDASGNYVYAISIGGTSSVIGHSIAVDAGGNAYITGQFIGTTDFDPGPGTADLTSAGIYDVFFAKYNPSGDYVYAKNIGGTLTDNGYGIAVDGSGNTYITGYFNGFLDSVDFDPGPGTAYLTSAGSYDIFFAVYDGSGNYLYAHAVGGPSDDNGYDLAIDNGGNIYLTGNFEGAADFDPGSGTANLTSVGGKDIFIMKYGLPVSVSDLENKTAFAVYPNPSAGKFTLEIEKAETGQWEINILNMLGQEESARTGNRQQTTGKNIVEIDLTGYSKGIYLLKIGTEKGPVYKKIAIE